MQSTTSRAKWISCKTMIIGGMIRERGPPARIVSDLSCSCGHQGDYLAA